jgi:ferrous iron transport protein A
MRTLRDATRGDTVTVARLHGAGAVKRRIMDMGLTRGTEVFIRKVAPLGDPVEISVRGTEVSIRKADAQLVEIEPEPEDGGDGTAADTAAAKPTTSVSKPTTSAAKPTTSAAKPAAAPSTEIA